MSTAYCVPLVLLFLCIAGMYENQKFFNHNTFIKYAYRCHDSQYNTRSFSVADLGPVCNVWHQIVAGVGTWGQCRRVPKPWLPWVLWVRSFCIVYACTMLSSWNVSQTYADRQAPLLVSCSCICQGFSEYSHVDLSVLHRVVKHLLLRHFRMHSIRYYWHTCMMYRGLSVCVSVPPLFSTGAGRVPHTPHFFGLKFVQKLVHCCNWLLTETQCKTVLVQQN